MIAMCLIASISFSISKKISKSKSIDIEIKGESLMQMLVSTMSLVATGYNCGDQNQNTGN